MQAIYTFRIPRASRSTAAAVPVRRAAYTSTTGTEAYVTEDPAAVVQSAAFYNNSKFDDYQPRPSGHADADAIAIDKAPLVVGAGLATFDNITSYDKGINGISIDLAGVHGGITADDFIFRVGNNNSPADWAAAPAPLSVTVYGQSGVSGSDRIELVWADGAIQNQWLEVTIAANSNTRLTSSESFYFGNAAGDTGAGDTTKYVLVNALDEAGAAPIRIRSAIFRSRISTISIEMVGSIPSTKTSPALARRTRLPR